MIRMRPTSRRPRAFTLVELMVAVAILSLVLVTFGVMLTQAEHAVTAATRNIYANQAANAAETVLRGDLRSAAPGGGFLCITVQNNEPRLILVHPGLAQSPTGGVRGTGACVSYGLVGNQGQRLAGQARGDNALYRQDWVLNPFEPAGPGVRPYDLGRILTLSPTATNGWVTWFLNQAPDGTNGEPIVDPPLNAGDLDGLWALLASGCRRVSITWSDSAPGGDIDWYGIQLDGTVQAQNGGWAGRGIGDWTAEQFEFAEDGNYRALWTLDNPTHWPTMIRVRLELTDPRAWAAGPPATDELNTYEFILPVGAR